MARVKRGVVSHARHKKVLKLAKGFYGRRKNTIRTAKAAVDRAGQYAYRDRKVLSDIAMHDMDGFKAVADKVRAALAA
jgi:large subunit ribosomal protein L20